MIDKKTFDLIQGLVPMAICDECVAKQVGAAPATVRKITDAFALTSDFNRYPGLCCRCGEDAQVTRGCSSATP